MKGQSSLSRCCQREHWNWWCFCPNRAITPFPYNVHTEEIRWRVTTIPTIWTCSVSPVAFFWGRNAKRHKIIALKRIQTTSKRQAIRKQQSHYWWWILASQSRVVSKPVFWGYLQKLYTIRGKTLRGEFDLVFDGYPSYLTNLNTKSAERLLRARKQASEEVLFNETMISTYIQARLLVNDNNKNRLIAILKTKFEESDFSVQ